MEVFIPEAHGALLREALTTGGFLREGNYDSVLAMSPVTGYWRPLEGASPFHGTVGQLTEAEEIKVEFRCRASEGKEAERVIRPVHPYETPVIFFIPPLD